MGITERKDREKTELKTQILNAARKLFLEQGFDKTSMRNIADLIEYSPGTIYHHFADKNAIFHALHSEGFRELGRRMMVLSAVADPLERLKAMGRIYVQYALENSDMYDLMFIKDEPIDSVQDDKPWEEANDVFGGLRMTVEECFAKGYFPGHDVEPFSYMIWSAVHGMVSLHIRKRCDVIDHTACQDIVGESFESLIKLLDQR